MQFLLLHQHIIPNYATDILHIDHMPPADGTKALRQLLSNGLEGSQRPVYLILGMPI